MNKQEIEDFRSKVKDWIECDNEINELKSNNLPYLLC